MSVLRKIVIGVAGGLLLLIGLALIFLPGPAIVVIPAALAVLAIEFAWARRWLKQLRDGVKGLRDKKAS